MTHMPKTPGCAAGRGGFLPFRRLVWSLPALFAVLFLLAAGHAGADDTPALLISEACGDNDFVWTLGFEDYLELYNPGRESVRLSDYSLQVKKKIVRLPEDVLEPGGYYVLRCGVSGYPGLSKSGFTATLLDQAGRAVDSVTVPECKNQVWLRQEGLSHLPSPGFANTPEGCGAWHASVQGSLIISEALSSNFRAFSEGGRGSDALELQNISDQPVQLAGYYLSDDRHNLTKFRLPSAVLQPGAFFTVLCRDDTDSTTSCGFKLSSGGESVYLSNGQGRVVDVLNIPPLALDVSYGWKDGVLGCMSPCTMGTANTGDLLYGAAEMPSLSVASSGGHAQPFTVAITGEGPIHYTTDCSEPTADSPLYTGPITITDSTTLRAAVIPEGMVRSDVVTAVYRFDTADYALPCVFITTDPFCLNSSSYGLLKNPEDRELEVPGHVVFLQTDGEAMFSLNCGFSISGQTARTRSNRGWKVDFSSRYGADHVDAPVFDDLNATRFDSLLFRLGTTGNPIHDILGTAIGAEVMPDVLYQHFRPVNLFISDRYYGIYYLREHVNKNFVANHLGGSEDQVDIIYNVSEVKAGSGEDWLALMSYCKTHDLSVQEHYEYVASMLNLGSFIDYFIWRPYTGDTDHPNIRYVRSRGASDSRWHIIIYDMDWAFQDRRIAMNKYTYRLYEEPRHNNLVIYSLLQNETFREAFLNRLAYHMQNTFDPVRVNQVLDQLLADTAADMPRNMKRWEISASTWEQILHSIRGFIQQGSYDRRTVLLRETQQFFGLSNDEMSSLFGDAYARTR